MTQPRNGMVLIIVAVVIALVTLSAMGFLVSMKTENRAAHLQADYLQASQVAYSADELVRQLSQLSRNEIAAWGGLHGNGELFQDVPVDVDEFGARHGRFSILTPEYAAEAGADPVYHFGVTCTSSKLSLAQLLIWDEQNFGHARKALMNLPGMTEAVADSILDWIDADDEPREFGAESEFYLGQDPPRQPPNRIPLQLDELLAVRGVNAWQLLGNRNGLQVVVRPDESDGLSVGTRFSDRPQGALPTPAHETQPSVHRSLPPAPPWSAFLTTASRERNETAAGRDRIDLNQRDLRRLHQQLVRAFDQETANFVVAVRQFGPSDTPLAEASPDSITAIPLTSGRPDYEFETVLDLVDVTVADRKVDPDESESAKSYRSPFVTQNPSTLLRLVELADATTTSRDRRVLHGRVNIQQAPRTVLLGLPGATRDMIDSLITKRQDVVDTPTARVHAVWLLAEGIVDVSTMKQLWPNVTVGGNVFEANVVSYYDSDSPWARHEIMIDGTTLEGRTLYYKDLRRLGRGFRYGDLVVPVDSFESNQFDASF